MTNLFKKNKLLKRSFWISKEQDDLINSEATKRFIKNRSALMRHIITNWFIK